MSSMHSISAKLYLTFLWSFQSNLADSCHFSYPNIPKRITCELYRPQTISIMVALYIYINIRYRVPGRGLTKLTPRRYRVIDVVHHRETIRTLYCQVISILMTTTLIKNTEAQRHTHEMHSIKGCGKREARLTKKSDRILNAYHRKIE